MFQKVMLVLTQNSKNQNALKSFELT